MTKPETPANRLLRLAPRSVAILRQEFLSQKASLLEFWPNAPRASRSEDVLGTLAVQPPSTAEFTWEPFPISAYPTYDSAGGLTASGVHRSCDDVKPWGPNAEELEKVAAAMRQRNLQRRASWRGRNLDLGEETEENQEELLAGAGRVNEAKPDTYEGYVSRGLGLIARYKHELNIRAPNEDIDPRIFVDWALALKYASTAGTWRNYRQAAAAAIRTIPSIHIEEAIGMLNEDLQVGADEGRSRRPLDGEVSERFAKRMEYLHFVRLKQTVLDLEPSKVSVALGHWLIAGIHTGLRPMEWETAFVEKTAQKDGSRIWLHVVAMRGGEGEHTYRSLDITTFGSEAREAVERMVELSRSWTSCNQFAVWQSEVAKMLGAICEDLFPRMDLPYKLYSLRYQFIANMASIYNREQLATIANYVPTGKKAEHYCKRRPYWLRDEIMEVPIPVVEQVARVKSRLNFLDERLAIQAMKKAAARRE